MSSSKAILSSALVAFLAVSPLVQAHMQLASPFPINSALNPNTPEAEKDYSMTSPLVASGVYPCKGYIGKGYDQGTIPTYTAGKPMAIKLAGTAVHGGGSCQLSLSYDNGTNFRVIESRIGGCPSDSLAFDVNLPSNAPAGKNVLFSWSWSNKLGNREFYQNCAIINIDSAATAPLTGPTIFVSNADVNSCTTIEQTPVVYPYPGDVVVYGGEYAGKSIGNGLTAGAGFTGTNCFAPGSDGAGKGSGSPSTPPVAASSSSSSSSSIVAPSSSKVASSAAVQTSPAASSTVISSAQPMTSSTESSSVQSMASSTISSSSQNPAPSVTSVGAIVVASSAVPSTSAEASSTSDVMSNPAPASSTPSPSPTSSAASAAFSAACSPDEWRCVGSVLQTCSWGSFVTIKDCSTQAGTVCDSMDPIGCVWPDQVVAPSVASVDVSTPVATSSATSMVTVNNAVATSAADAQPTTTSASAADSTPSTSAAASAVSTSASPSTEAPAPTTPAAQATAASTTCEAGSWACKGSILQQCVNGSLMDLTDCKLQTGTVCNASMPIGCVWPWQATSFAKRDAADRVPRGHGDARRAVHGKRRSRTH